VEVRWSTDLAADGPPATATGVDDARMEGDRWCFTTTAASLVRWDLPRAVAGTNLAVAFDVRIDRTTSYAWYVSDGKGGFEHASFDVHRIGRADRVGYETVRQPTVRSLALSGLAPGARACLGGVRLIAVQTAG
jgi:hypothetical protein